ncbi:sugar ABC transporter permease [Paenibacillus beijingensis]|uniref:Sugar ABC transporter permease n=2 Tax=Paenibacillus beijingensis TaxID=1126833 RepID=A0A0D5NRA2_9BACL|nr:sugar ABC transporter permease [Paenibacillus beijingensis]
MRRAGIIVIPVIIVLILCATSPFIWMIMASFKKNADILNPDRMLLFDPTLKNYISVFTTYSLIKPIMNSILISVISTVVACVFGLPTAYAIARWKMNFFASIILVIRIIPAISYLVPWHIMFAQMKLSGTYTALVLAYTLSSLPLIIWIMIPYFSMIPKELEQSAVIDGSSLIGSFARIVLPLSMPGILTSAILALIFAWNNFLYALVLSGKNTGTLPMAIFNFISYTKIEWGGLMAATVVITLPIIVISLLLQKYVVSGLTAGAVKG